MSDSLVDFSSGSASHDFTTSQSSAFSAGADGLAALAGGRFGMHGGDYDADGAISTGDFGPWFEAAKALQTGYFEGDMNLDHQASVGDFGMFFENLKALLTSQVPT